MSSKLFVGGLSYSTTSESLRRHFAACGTVLSATVVTDRVTGRSRGFGFVELSSEAEAQEAIVRFHGQPFEGRRLNVSRANPEARRASRARGGRPGGQFRGGPRQPVRW
jgi:RNA recognition motif-containing protein